MYKKTFITTASPSPAAAADGHQRLQPSVTAYLPAGDVSTVFGSGSSHRKGSRPRRASGCSTTASAALSGTPFLSPAALAAVPRPFCGGPNRQRSGGDRALPFATRNTGEELLVSPSDVIPQQLWANFSLTVTGPWRAAADLQWPNKTDAAEGPCRHGGSQHAQTACPASVPTPHRCERRDLRGGESPASAHLKGSESRPGAVTARWESATCVPVTALTKAANSSNTSTDDGLQDVSTSKETSDRDVTPILLTSRNKSSSSDTPHTYGELSSDKESSIQDVRTLHRKMRGVKRVSFSAELHR
ncbi:hypothetical protein STCU_09920 [Strigomonas culicis]|uniref:Uncharacterized protein n=1 Tax=Strigomonas culicis TaxID=28005 RepID=S9V689_9TRYP|nr:hypothetical protein STCU_09920 [Strigomonas culicis]|eukprot:EPY18430.1 hypothetical protein STCU_09920 [Strigomonas culicis]